MPIITFLILKYDIIENSRIELRGIVLPVQVGGLLGGPKGMLAPPPLKLLGGGGGAGPPGPYAYVRYFNFTIRSQWEMMYCDTEAKGCNFNGIPSIQQIGIFINCI